MSLPPPQRGTESSSESTSSSFDESAKRYTGAQVIGRDHLNAEQLAPLQRYIAAARAGQASCIGALVGFASWDVRPLLLENRELSILRFSDPTVADDQVRYRALRETASRLAPCSSRCGFLAGGEFEAQIWIRRRFFVATALESKNSFPSRSASEQIEQLLRLITTLMQFHRAGVVHGHLSLANISWDDAVPTIFDFGLAALSPVLLQRLDPVAPELKLAGQRGGGAVPTAASDNYCLGLILEMLRGGVAEADEQTLIDQLVETDPRHRPDLDTVERFYRDRRDALDSARPPRGEPMSKIAGAVPHVDPSPRQIQPTEPRRKEPTQSLSTNLLTAPVPRRDKPVAEPPDADRSTAGASPHEKPSDPREEASRTPRGASREKNERRRETAAAAPPLHERSTRDRDSRSAAPRRNNREDPMQGRHGRRKRSPASQSEPIPVPEAQPAQRRSIVAWLPIVILLPLLSFYWAVGRHGENASPNGGGNIVPDAVQNSAPRSDYESLWRSGQPSLMKEVVTAALQNEDPVARAAIVGAILKGAQPVNVRDELIRVAFDPRWEAQLSPNDRRIAIALAVTQFMPEALQGLPPLSTAHPAVIFAIMATTSIETPMAPLQEIKVQHLTGLPAPIGPAFGEFSKLPAATVGSANTRALAHILNGSTHETIVSKYFDNTADELATLRKLRILLPLLQRSDALERATYTTLFANSKIITRILRWFEDEPIGSWEKVAKRDKLALVSGILPDTQLTFEQYSDLLHFPNQRVASAAAERLDKGFFKGRAQGMLEFLSSSKNKLSRAQTVTVLATTPLKGDEAFDFLSRWFGSNPDPQSVLALLLTRNEGEKIDPFSFTAANYLSENTRWQADFATLRKLIAHSEPLARALAYARLDPRNAEQRKVLENMATSEPKPNLRELIQNRLSDLPN